MEERTIHKAYKFRLYPNAQQRAFMGKTFGCCRFVYNHFLAVRIDAFEQKRGFEALDDYLEADGDGLTCMIADEAGHFAAIYDQRPDRRARDLRLLKDYRPGVYAAYWLWAEGEGLAKRGVNVPTRFDMSKMLTILKRETLDEGGSRGSTRPTRLRSLTSCRTSTTPSLSSSGGSRGGGARPASPDSNRERPIASPTRPPRRA